MQGERRGGLPDRRASAGTAGRNAAVIAVAVLAAAPGAVPERLDAQAGAGWTQFRRTAALEGRVDAALPAALTLAWSHDAGSPVESSAAIADGTAYVGTAGGRLLALDLSTGRVRWSYMTDPDVGIGESSPAVAGGVVYVGDLAGTFHAVDAATGQAKWTFRTRAEIKSSPVVVGQTVLIGSYDGRLYGLDADTGRERWQVRTENYVHATPAIWNGVAYFGGCDEYFHGVRVSDGAEVMSLGTGAYTAASAAIRDGVAYFGTFSNEVVALDLEKKTLRWRFEDPDRQFPFYSSAALSADAMVLGGRDKVVRAIDLGTGRERWAFMTRARVDSSPAIAGDKVVVGGGDGKVYLLDLATGRRLWEYETGAGFTASPSVAGGLVVIGDLDGRIYAFR